MRLLAALILLVLSSLVHATSAREVFVLHSYSQEYPWTRGQHEGFVRELTRSLGRGLSVRVEYLDTKRVPYDEAYAALMATQLAAKYRGYTPDAVYVSDDNALTFALDHMPAFFPRAPVFFSGVNDYGVRARLDPSRHTGVFERKEIAPNLELVRLMAPGDHDIVVVGDASETYRAIERELRAELARFPGIRARFVAHQRLPRLLADLDAGNERFLILTTLGAMVDERGQPLMLGETMAALVARHRHTVISMEDAYLFPGVLGGYVTSGGAQGAAAARLMARHLGGVPVAAIPPVEASPNQYLFDSAEMARAGLSLPAALAREATVLNAPPSFFRRNEAAIVATLYTLAALLVLVLAGALAVVLRKNRQIGASARALRAQAARMAEVQESLTRAQRIAGMGNWDWRIPENRLYWSEGIYRLFGIDSERFGASYEAFLERVHPDDRRRVETAVLASLREGAPYDITHRIALPGGDVRVVRETAEIERGPDGAPLRMIGSVLDVTERERTARALSEREQTLRTVVEGLPVVLWMIDLDGRFLLSEGKGLEAMGLAPGQLVGESLFEHYRDHADLLDDARRVLAGETFAAARWIGEAAFELRYSPLRDARGRIAGAIGVAIDVTERKRSEDRLAFLANYDTVTGLPNRFLFRDRLSHAMRGADRDQTRVALLFVDLDHFKTINDSLGHAAGDDLLKQVAQRLGQAVRAVDTVSRLGGDEFTVLLENLDQEEEAARVAAGILELSARPYRLQDREVYVTPSVGIALYPQDGATVDALVMNADAAMYRAKENGRNGFQFFTREINVRAQERLDLGNQLRGALGRGEFSLHFQPQLSLSDGRVTGFEGLLRWRREGGEPVSPATFIPVLEETGAIIDVGDWVIEQACRWAAALEAPADGGPPLVVAVNLSARQFRQPRLDRVVEKALAASGLPAGRLELEITESTLLDLESNVQTMDRLKQLGVGLAIDDFGTGYSSLSYLKRFPVDRIKVDASFVRDVAVDPDDAAIVTAIIAMSRNLGLGVIAEGVETAAQMDFLRERGCDEVQGYLVARPMPGAEARDWLARRSGGKSRSAAGQGR